MLMKNTNLFQVNAKSGSAGTYLFSSPGSTIPRLCFLDTHNKYFIHMHYTSVSSLKVLYHYWLFLFIPFWFKLTFRGKGFRVRKFCHSQKLTFNFGRSH